MAIIYFTALKEAKEKEKQMMLVLKIPTLKKKVYWGRINDC